MLQSVGALRVHRNEFASAVVVLERAAARLTTTGQTGLYARCAHNLSLAYAPLGRYDDALRAAQRAFDLRDLAPADDEIRLKARTNLASILVRVGDPAAARAHAVAAEAESRGRPPAERGEALGTLGHVRRELGDPEAAATLYAASLTEFAAAADARRVGVGAVSLARLHAERLHPTAAEGAARVAFALLHADPGLRGYATYELGVAAAGLGRDGAAALALADARTCATAAQDLDLEVATCIELGALRLRHGDRPAAAAHADRALDLLERCVVGLTDDRTAGARAQRARLFEVAVAAAVGDPDTAWRAVERCRAVGLASALGGARPWAAADRQPALEAALEAAARARRKAADRVAAAPDGERRRAARADLDVAEAAHAVADDRLRRERGLHLTGVAPAPAAPAAVGAALADGEAFVSVSTVGPRAFALGLRRGDAHPRPVRLGPSSAVRARWLALDRRSPLAAYRAAADDLVALGLGADVRRATLSVDAELAGVPWTLVAALRRGPDGRPDPLALTLAPSAGAATSLRARARAGGGARLGVGLSSFRFVAALGADVRRHVGGALDDLPRAEADATAAAAGGPTLLGDAATEGAVAAALDADRPWGLVHLSTHGTADPHLPLRGGLLFRPSAGRDGFLSARELLDLRVHADLVVLAACTSAGGADLAGEGRLGLPRVLLLVGARRVVAALWPVRDGLASDLLDAFHARRRGGAPDDVALAAALAGAATRDDPHALETAAAWQLWGTAD